MRRSIRIPRDWRPQDENAPTPTEKPAALIAFGEQRDWIVVGHDENGQPITAPAPSWD